MSTTKDAVECIDRQVDILRRKAGVKHVGSLLAAQQEKLDLQYFDILCMVQIGVNSIAEHCLRNFLKELRKYPEYLKFGLKRELDLIEQGLNQYIKALCECLARRGEHINIDPMEMQCKIADMADYSDEQMGRLLDDMHKFLSKHTPKGGECAPREPELYQLMHEAFAMVALAGLIYEHNMEIFPKYFKTIKLSFMDFSPIMRRTEKVIARLLKDRYKNKFGRPLKINSFAIWDTPEWKGTIDETGAYRNGLMPRMRDAFFSTKYIDSLYIIRDGQDPKFRELTGSFFEGMRQSNDIQVATT